MRLATIGARLAAQLMSPSLVTAGLLHAYYPAPGSIPEGPAAVIFSGNGESPAWSEQIWHHELRVQLLQPANGVVAPALNALERLIEPIWDHFKPGSPASQLIVSGQPGAVTHCYPRRYEGSQVVEYGSGTQYAAITIIFEVKSHRFAGDS